MRAVGGHAAYASSRLRCVSACLGLELGVNQNSFAET
jgi:hypothetical protein